MKFVSKTARSIAMLLNSINPTGIPKHELTLKKNAIIMVLRNLDKAEGIVNGTRLKVREMRQFVRSSDG